MNPLTKKRGGPGVYRCGVCTVKGHTRDTCPDAKPYKRVEGWRPGNGNYQHNRSIGACPDCGRPSKKSRCRVCTRKRKEWPSRTPQAIRAEKDRRGYQMKKRRK